jgi:hypothetical protein
VPIAVLSDPPPFSTQIQFDGEKESTDENAMHFVPDRTGFYLGNINRATPEAVSRTTPSQLESQNTPY